LRLLRCRVTWSDYEIESAADEDGFSLQFIKTDLKGAINPYTKVINNYIRLTEENSFYKSEIQR
uniref:hypothetical protein n=1 Tax=Bacillus sp. S1-R5C1-FB TaxID=1973491 RepID=UPI001C50045D